jgi:hypothetical protein
MNMDHMNAALESIADLARTLKEERDAALADATALAERLTVLELTSTSELARLERERDEAREDAEYWKDSLKLLGETPEQVFESWRIRHTNVFKYIRLMVSWREKYNISKKEAEYYRERDEQLKDERETARESFCFPNVKAEPPRTNDNRITKDAKERLASSDLFSSPLNHLVVLHRVIYGTIEPELALAYLHQHLRDDADLADLGRPLKYQYQENVEDSHAK